MTEFLQDNLLFLSLEREEIDLILAATPHWEKSYAPGEIVVHQGDVVKNIGIVLSGEVQGKKYTAEGMEIVVNRMGENDIFADVLSGANGFASPVTIQALSRCKILFIDYRGLLFSRIPAAHIVLQNMIKNISQKYFAQNRRMDILMLKTVRKRVMAYLSRLREEKGGDIVDSPLDRRLMADFLAVDRTALSRELSKMKAEGLIDYRKNKFTLYF